MLSVRTLVSRSSRSVLATSQRLHARQHVAALSAHPLTFISSSYSLSNRRNCSSSDQSKSAGALRAAIDAEKPKLTVEQILNHVSIMEQWTCSGCGIELQYKEPKQVGYFPKQLLSNVHDLKELKRLRCERCFQMTQYGKISDTKMPYQEYERRVMELRSKDMLMIQLVDILDISGSLLPKARHIFGKKPVMLVVNKGDLVPTKEAGIDNLISIYLISAMKRIGMKEIVEDVAKYRQNRDICVVGAANLSELEDDETATMLNIDDELLAEAKAEKEATKEGEQTIKTPHGELYVAPGEDPEMIETSSEEDREMTTSPLPGTTLAVQYLPVMKLVEVLALDGAAKLKNVFPAKQLPVTTYRVRPGRSLFLGALARFDYETLGKDIEKNFLLLSWYGVLPGHLTNTELCWPSPTQETQAHDCSGAGGARLRLALRHSRRPDGTAASQKTLNQGKISVHTCRGLSVVPRAPLFPYELSDSKTRFTRRVSKAASNSSTSSSPQKTSSFKLYANMVSSPVAVAWALKVKGADYEFVNVEFSGDLIKSDEFKTWNPNGLVPVLRDGDFSLFEGNAILAYAAVKFGWKDLYPTDRQTRAKVDEFLNWHHTNTRLFTVQILRPAVAKVSGKASPMDFTFLENVDALIEKEMTLLEAFLDKDFVAHTDAPTIADYAAYCEIDQLEMMGYDFSQYPKVTAWIARMKQIPYHNEVREDLDKFLTKLGLRVETEAKTDEPHAVYSRRWHRYLAPNLHHQHIGHLPADLWSIIRLEKDEEYLTSCKQRIPCQLLVILQSAVSNSSSILYPISTMTLTLYANLISQPSRTVAWVLKVKGVDHELVPVLPGSDFFKSDEFKAINPNRLVPAIKDDDFVLTEGMAILQYLGDKYDWTGPKDLYPRTSRSALRSTSSCTGTTPTLASLR
ncbi:P-loop containing nucleoside triphosphate hydrolase [Phytophthora cactorum]|nr:P-loop containing nucleoside triphosphate hydrolase [Phytophthora cactorum]